MRMFKTECQKPKILMNFQKRNYTNFLSEFPGIFGFFRLSWKLKFDKAETKKFGIRNLENLDF